MVNPEHIKAFFRLLNEKKIAYVLPKNDGNLIPDAVEDGKDIDIIVMPEDYEKFLNTMLQAGFERLPGESKKYFFLYKLRPDLYLKKDDAFFHAYEKLSCVSLTNMGLSKIPLDDMIQDYLWKNRIWDEKNHWWIADNKITLLFLVVRSVFDKKFFRPIYVREIEARKNLLDSPEFITLCKPIFFKYTSRLIQLLKAGRYDEIPQDYLHFCDY